MVPDSKNPLRFDGESKLPVNSQLDPVFRVECRSSTSVSMLDLRQCVSNPQMNYLQLMDAKIDGVRINDGHCAMLVDLLKDHPKLEILDLRYNDITIEGFKTLMRGLRSHVALQRIYLNWNNLDPGTLDTIRIMQNSAFIETKGEFSGINFEQVYVEKRL